MSLYRPPITVLGATQYERQPTASLDQTPSQDQWYTILDTKTNVSVFGIRIWQWNGNSAAKSVRLRLTIDTETILSSLTSIAHNTHYFGVINAGGNLGIGASELNAAMYGPIFAKSFKAEIQFADTPGTGQKLYADIPYAKLKATTL